MAAAISGAVVRGWGVPATAAVTTALASTVALLALRGDDSLRQRFPTLRAGRRYLVAMSLRTGAGTAVLLASTSALGSLILPLSVVAALTSPPLLAACIRGVAGSSARRATTPPHQPPHKPRPRWRRRRATVHPPAQALATQVTASSMRAAVALLDDPALCHAWRASYGCLALAATDATRGELVHLRQAYLDELERRHPSGLRTWLESGARAAGDPTRHLRPRPAADPAGSSGPHADQCGAGQEDDVEPG